MQFILCTLNDLIREAEESSHYSPVVRVRKEYMVLKTFSLTLANFHHLLQILFNIIITKGNLSRVTYLIYDNGILRFNTRNIVILN